MRKVGYRYTIHHISDRVRTIRYEAAELAEFNLVIQPTTREKDEPPPLIFSERCVQRQREQWFTSNRIRGQTPTNVQIHSVP